MKATFLGQPFGTKRVGDWLRDNLANPSWTRFQAAVAFAKLSGTRHITDRLAEFCSKRQTVLSVGIDHRGTSKEALQALLDTMSGQALYVCHHDRSSITFHPKVYLFTDDDAASALVGSNNLTEGGLFHNYEASLAVDLNLNDSSDKELYSELQGALASWSDLSSSIVKTLDKTLLGKLVNIGLVPTEEQITTERKYNDSLAKKNPMLSELLSRRIFGDPAIPPAPIVSSTVKNSDEDGSSGGDHRPESHEGAPHPAPSKPKPEEEEAVVEEAELSPDVLLKAPQNRYQPTTVVQGPRVRARIARAEARARGLKWYYTGFPCKYGHVEDRLVSNGKCRECNRQDCERANKLGLYR